MLRLGSADGKDQLVRSFEFEDFNKMKKSEK